MNTQPDTLTELPPATAESFALKIFNGNHLTGFFLDQVNKWKNRVSDILSGNEMSECIETLKYILRRASPLKTTAGEIPLLLVIPPSMVPYDKQMQLFSSYGQAGICKIPNGNWGTKHKFPYVYLGVDISPKENYTLANAGDLIELNHRKQATAECLIALTLELPNNIYGKHHVATGTTFNDLPVMLSLGQDPKDEKTPCPVLTVCDQKLELEPKHNLIFPSAQRMIAIN